MGQSIVLPLEFSSDATPTPAVAWGDWFAEAERSAFDCAWGWLQVMGRAGVFEGAQPGLWVYSESGRPAAAWPVMRTASALGGRQVRGLYSYYSSRYRPLFGPEAAPAGIAAEVRAWVDAVGLDVMRFDALESERPEPVLLREVLARAGLSVFEFFCFGNWYLPVAPGGYAAYLAARPSALRHTIARRGRQFAQGGRGRLWMATTPEQAEQAIPVWQGIYAASWKQPEPYPAFMPGMIRWCARRGWLRLAIAEWDGTPVAAQVWIVSHGRAAIYKLAYDEAHARLSAGTLLTDFMMRHVIDVDQVEEVDYGVGDEPYKRDWMTCRRERHGLVAYNPRRPLGALGLARELAGRGVKRWLGPRNRG